MTDQANGFRSQGIGHNNPKPICEDPRASKYRPYPCGCRVCDTPRFAAGSVIGHQFEGPSAVQMESQGDGIYGSSPINGWEVRRG